MTLENLSGIKPSEKIERNDNQSELEKELEEYDEKAYESPKLVIARKARALGYIPCNIFGSTISDSHVDILKPLGYERCRRLFGLITYEREIEPDFIGTVWINNVVRGATPNNMLMEVYGRKYLNEMVKFAKDFSDELYDRLNVNVRVQLKEENPNPPI